MIDDAVDEEEIDPQGEAFAACSKVLQAGHWLMANDWGNMRILPYIAPSGAHWRCEFHPVGKPSRPFYRYTSASIFRFSMITAAEV